MGHAPQPQSEEGLHRASACAQRSVHPAPVAADTIAPPRDIFQKNPGRWLK